MSQRVGPGNSRKRGHQHHPRNNGTRSRRTTLDPTTDMGGIPNRTTKIASPAVLVPNNQKSVIPSASSRIEPSYEASDSKVTSNLINNDIIDLTNCDDDDYANSKNNSKSFEPVLLKSSKDKHNSRIRKQSKYSTEKIEDDFVQDMSLVERPAAEGSSQSDQEEDPEIEELAKLRCPSERAEVVAEREIRRRNRRCADYPGLAFGSSIFSSDTLMKFSIIRNELHNIMNTQLKRVGLFPVFLNILWYIKERDKNRTHSN